MRSTIELLQLLRENKRYFDSGLCGLASCLYAFGLISSEERRVLREFIATNKPKKVDTVYYWPIGEWEPRNKWIKEQQLKLAYNGYYDKRGVPSIQGKFHKRYNSGYVRILQRAWGKLRLYLFLKGILRMDNSGGQ